MNYVEPNQILSYISKMLKILFINKSNEVLLTMYSNIAKIKIDICMLKYLIC
jgi:hypothetical protein